MVFEREIAASVAYLDSEAARAAIATDIYWPKWDHPWWHMLLLHELRLTHLIPQSIVQPFISGLDKLAVKTFPLKPGDSAEGPCHCQMGNVYQVLSARGVDLDTALPWTKSWFAPYQMADGGLNCDESAYHVKGECPSSMVGTIAAFEAMLLYAKRPWSDVDAAFIDRAAKFLIARQLVFGSDTKHNAAERVSAETWPKLSFPRYYFYDVLRGLNALTLWSEITGAPLPPAAVARAVEHMERAFPDGRVRVGRRTVAGTGTVLRQPNGEWTRGHPSTTFPLLDAVSVLDAHSEVLSLQWREVRSRLSS
jgi:hypothetical protein